MAECATVVRPYAKAIYQLALEKKQLQPWLQQIALLSKVIAEPKVESLLRLPAKGKEDQAKILLDIVASEKLDPLVQNFVTVLAQNGRLFLMPLVFEEYQRLVLSEDRTQQAVIYSAFPLEGKELDDLVSRLEKKLNTKLQARVVLDPGVIGGVKIEFGDQVLDMSIQSDLNALYAAMVN